MHSRKIATIPWGLPPVGLLIYYVLVCTLSGNVIAATESLKHLMRLGGVFGHLGGHEQEMALIEVTARGVSVSIVFALFGGVINDYVGPKFTAILGQLFSAGGFLLIFLSDPSDISRIKLGCCFVGCAYSCVSISHTSIASLFPGNATLAITMLCVGNDLSLGVTLIMSSLAKHIGVSYVVCLYVVVNIVLCHLEVFLVPSTPFCSKSLAASRSVTTTPTNDTLAIRPVERPTTDDDDDGDEDLNDMSKASLSQQMCTYHYWALTAFISFCFFRRVHYAQLVRLIDEHVAVASGAGPEAAAHCVEWFKRLLPLTMVGAFVTGSITNRVGIIWGMVLVNTYGVVLSLLASFEHMWMQYLAILFFDLFGCFIFGLMYAFLGGYFGFATMGVLQAMLKLVCGCIGELITPWCTNVVLRLPSILVSNMILSVVGVAFYAIPLSLAFYPLGGFARARRLKNTQPKPIGNLTNQLGETDNLARDISDHSLRVRRSIAMYGVEAASDTYKRLSQESKIEASSYQRLSATLAYEHSDNRPLRDSLPPNYMSAV